MKDDPEFKMEISQSLTVNFIWGILIISVTRALRSLSVLAFSHMIATHRISSREGDIAGHKFIRRSFYNFLCFLCAPLSCAAPFNSIVCSILYTSSRHRLCHLQGRRRKMLQPDTTKGRHQLAIFHFLASDSFDNIFIPFLHTSSDHTR